MTNQFPDCLNDRKADQTAADAAVAAARQADQIAASAVAAVAGDDLAIAGALKSLGKAVLDVVTDPANPRILSSSDGTTVSSLPILVGTIPFPAPATPPTPTPEPAPPADPGTPPAAG